MWTWQQMFRYDTKSRSNNNNKMDKLDFIKKKTFCASKYTVKRVKRQLTV